MSFILLIPVFLSSLLIAAHFMRMDLMPAVILCLAVPFVLFCARKWAVRLVQIFLILSALEWVRTMFSIAQTRAQMGMPWIRMAVILSSVTLFTAASAYIFLAKPLKKRYKL